ncbi:phosphatidic acid phosphatase [Massilicoli timonensis]|uniref:phosphatidic acid phosphatase n=1 Tax=Massilicoli timonensis TaxID=2015901 RepID=UPI0015E12E18|nr:phosphatidic acid phosphatase [Massilicoli timonensis]
MRLGPPAVDYRHFKFSKLNTPEYRHLILLLYWPAFGLLFMVVERLWIRESYYPISCSLDNAIPFCEYFLIPYLFWFAFLVGIHLYTLLYDVESFKRLMKLIMLSYSAAILIYMVFPNCQELRPVAFEHDNLLTWFIEGFYQFDTNTNVCPSLHVIGSSAVMACAWHSRHFSTKGWRMAFSSGYTCRSANLWVCLLLCLWERRSKRSSSDWS